MHKYFHFIISLFLLFIIAGCDDSDSKNNKTNNLNNSNNINNLNNSNNSNNINNSNNTNNLNNSNNVNNQTPPYTLSLELSSKVVFMNENANLVSARCVLRDDSGSVFDATDIEVSLTFDSSVIDNNDGTYSFESQGSYTFSCEGLKTDSSTISDTKTVFVTMDSMPDTWVYVSREMFKSSVGYDNIIGYLHTKDSSSMRGVAAELETGYNYLNSLTQNSRLTLLSPLPSKIPDATQCDSAGLPLSADDAEISSKLGEIATEIVTVRNMVSSLDPDAPDATVLNDISTEMTTLQAKIDNYKILNTTPCGGLQHIDDFNSLILNQFLPLITELKQFSYLNINSMADFIDNNPNFKFSMMGMTMTMTVQAQLNQICFNMYGSLMETVAIWTETLILADAIEAWWSPEAGGPVIQGDVTTGGLADVCDNQPLNSFWGESFISGNNIPETTSIGVLVVGSAQVTAIEGIFEAADCDADSCSGGTGSMNKCKANHYFSCIKKMGEAFENALNVIDNVAPTIVSIEPYITEGSIVFQFAIPYQATGIVPIEPIILFPWSGVTGRGQRWDGTLYGNCQ